MTSLGVAVRNIVEDLRDGIKLLQVMDVISPGIVDWKKVNMNPKNTYTQTENANYAVALGKKLNFSMVGIAGKDFVDGNRKLMLALIWQMMKLHVFSILSKINKFGGEPTQEDILNWANQKVKSSGKDAQMKDFKDASLSSSKFLIDLLNALRPRVVDYSLVTNANTGNFWYLKVVLNVSLAEEKMLNAKYAISVARKIGCCIFLLWEDIVEVNPKMILTFVATLMTVSN
jgi:plastin-1